MTKYPFLRTWIAAIAICVAAFDPGSSFGGNGTGRGGGDEYSAEVFHIARGIAKKLRHWSQDGTLKLTPDQVTKVENLVDMSNETAADPNPRLLEIYSYDHVYKHPELAPKPEADETTLINVYAAKPPRIEVGRGRWDGLRGKSTEKEMMVLHELLGAAGILKKGERIDDQFRVSYELKLSALREWGDFKEMARTNLISLRILGGRVIDPDWSHFTAIGKYMENLPQYDQVMHPEKYAKGAKAIKKLRFDAYNQIVEWYDRSKVSLADDTLSADKKRAKEANDFVEAFKTELHPFPAAWTQWAEDMLTRYVSVHREALAAVGAQLTTQIKNDYLTRKCGLAYAAPVEKLLPCFVDAYRWGDFAKQADPEVRKQKAVLEVEFNKILDQLELILNPDDLHSGGSK